MVGFDFQNRKLVHSQVENKIRVLIISGGYAAGEKMPAIAEMASKLAVNPQHIIAAYESLKEACMLRQDDNKDYYVVDRRLAMQSRVDELLREFDAITEELVRLDATGDMLKQRIENAIDTKEERGTTDDYS